MYHNIEKHLTRKGVYLAYGDGDVWRVRKELGTHWVAVANSDGRVFRADTLREVSSKLELWTQAKRLPNPFTQVPANA